MRLKALDVIVDFLYERVESLVLESRQRRLKKSLHYCGSNIIIYEHVVFAGPGGAGHWGQHIDRAVRPCLVRRPSNHRCQLHDRKPRRHYVADSRLHAERHAQQHDRQARGY